MLFIFTNRNWKICTMTLKKSLTYQKKARIISIFIWRLKPIISELLSVGEEIPYFDQNDIEHFEDEMEMEQDEKISNILDREYPLDDPLFLYGSGLREE